MAFHDPEHPLAGRVINGHAVTLGTQAAQKPKPAQSVDKNGVVQVVDDWTSALDRRDHHSDGAWADVRSDHGADLADQHIP